MTTTHETGHVIGGWLGGGRLVSLDLAPWRLPHSIHVPDPHPLLTLWAGPVVGIAAPTLIAVVVRRPAGWFVADFCWLANGVYLGLAAWAGDRHLDTPRMIAAGTPAWCVAMFCLISVSVGYLRFRRDCIALLTGNVS